MLSSPRNRLRHMAQCRCCHDALDFANNRGSRLRQDARKRLTSRAERNNMRKIVWCPVLSTKNFAIWQSVYQHSAKCRKWSMLRGDINFAKLSDTHVCLAPQKNFENNQCRAERKFSQIINVERREKSRNTAFIRCNIVVLPRSISLAFNQCWAVVFDIAWSWFTR